MLHERANAEIQLCSNKQAATELQMRHLQEELREAQTANARKAAVGEDAPAGVGSTAAAGTSSQSSEKNSSLMPSPVPYMKDESRKIPSQWPLNAPKFTPFHPSAGMTFRSTTTMQQRTLTFNDPNDRSDLGWYGLGAFAPAGESVPHQRDNGGNDGRDRDNGGGGGGNGRRPPDDSDDDKVNDKKKSKKKENKKEQIKGEER